MKTDFNHCESLYWVFTQLCNDQCAHCYNLSGPQGNRISTEECLQIIDNLPDRIDRLILSGGEPLAEWSQLLTILDRLNEKYQGRTQLMLQTNGDLLTEEKLDTLLAKNITRIDIASIDRYHKKKGQRIETLSKLLQSRSMSDEDPGPLVEKGNYVKPKLTFGFWGATEDMWLGGNWARGRAMMKNTWKKDPNHNFCAILSGARGFLGGEEDIPQEVSVQLWQINPCCPGTKEAMGDARSEKVADVLERVSHSPIFQKLNKGAAWNMGESVGISEEYARERTQELQNICLWCDEFFGKHYDIKNLQPKNPENQTPDAH